ELALSGGFAVNDLGHLIGQDGKVFCFCATSAPDSGDPFASLNARGTTRQPLLGFFGRETFGNKFAEFFAITNDNFFLKTLLSYISHELTNVLPIFEV